MSAEVELKITRADLVNDEVDRALARQRALEGRAAPAPLRVSLLRRLLLSSMFYLPLAGLIGALGAWFLVDPLIQDHPRAAGQVVLINNDPFDHRGMVSITVGDREVLVDRNKTFGYPGAHGEQPFRGLEQIRVGSLIDAAGAPDALHDKRFAAVAVRPTSEAEASVITAAASRKSALGLMIFFPVTATLVALALLFAEGVSRRNWTRLLDRCLAGTALAALFSFLVLIPGGLVFSFGHRLLQESPDSRVVHMIFVTCRSIGWACAGLGLGFGMNVARSTKPELRNTLVGGALGGAFGGLFFDPIGWIVSPNPFDGASTSRLVGVIAIGVSVGAFVALLERLTREAWVRVRTGPLAGKSFVLYRTPTTIGSAPSADIYLFKDAAIDPHHASIHRVGQAFEIEDQGSREGTEVGGQAVRRRRLASGDQIVVGSTVLEFEERALRAVAEVGGSS